MKTTNNTKPQEGDTLDCGHVMTTGHGYGTKPNGFTMCYPCCAAEDRNTIANHKPLGVYFTFPAENRGGPYRRVFTPSVTGATVGNWPGTVLGHILKASVAESVVGGRTIVRMVSIRVRMFDGSIYIGRGSWDGGGYINIRKAAR